MRSTLMLILVIFSMGHCLEQGSLTCKDWIYDYCEWPTYEKFGKQINVPNVEACLQKCHDLGEDECKFIMFDNHPNEVFNCEIRDDEMDDFLATCKTEGQPLWNELGQELNKGCSESDCIFCNNCLNCLDSPCVGMAGNECVMNEAPAETLPGVSSYSMCAVHCRVLGMDIMYAIFDYESHLCTCFSHGDRSCNKKLVKFGTDLSKC